jgi:hypothetical protein
MKKILYLSLLILILAQCNSKKLSPESDVKTWFAPCSSFSKDKDGYILGGCCYNVTIPSLVLNKNEPFSKKGMIRSGDGKGNYTETEVEVNGNLSPDGKNLYVSFTYKNKNVKHEFSIVESNMVCDCMCL